MQWGFSIEGALNIPVMTAMGISLPYVGVNNMKRGMRFNVDGVRVAFHPCA
tara:strand:+ start:198 stop:350 length:153 start_codon:yes stop_codon:yes gene_type:complete